MVKNENIYLPILMIWLLLVIYKIYGKFRLLFSILLVSCYSLIIGILFFTYGAYIEKLAIEEQLSTITQKIKKSEAAATDLNPDYNFPSFPKPVPNNELDKQVEKNNKKILEDSLAVLFSFFFFGVLVFYLIYKYTDSKDINLKRLLEEVAIIAVIIIIIEIAFSYGITKNYRALKANDILVNFNTSIQEKYA